MNDSEWWRKPFNSVTLEFPAADIPTIDVASIVNKTHDGGVDCLMIFAVGYYPGGGTFYQSKIAPHYPTLGSRDLLLEGINAAHANGQKACAFVSCIWGNKEMLIAYPDWAQRKNDGSLNSWDEENNTVAMCPLSGYRRYFFSVIKEISDNYDVDGFYFDEPSYQSWCACDHCKNKYRQDTQRELPLKADYLLATRAL